MNKKQLLLSSKVLEALTENEKLNLLKEGKFKISTYGRNAVLHFAEEPCTKLEIILSGEAAIERIDEGGNTMIIANFHSQDIIGGNLLFSKDPSYPMTITAKEESIILEVDKDALIDILLANEAFLRLYLEYIADNATILHNKINSFINRTIRESILNFLNQESKKQHSKQIKLNMTKKALAELIGVQRTSLSRELAKMKTDNLIEYTPTTITIIN